MDDFWITTYVQLVQESANAIAVESVSQIFKNQAIHNLCKGLT